MEKLYNRLTPFVTFELENLFRFFLLDVVKGGNLISEVAKLMGPMTAFNNEGKSIKKGEKELSNPAYRKAVFNYLKSHPALEDKILILPPDTFFINSK